jgi:aphidicolan-16beta-ol synthase/syn-copalyl-diphosphate synthase
MVEVFEGKAHFKTYSLERDPSFSANCNALLALLHRPNVLRFGGQIVKIVKFLCDYWWKSNGSITDKWVSMRIIPHLLMLAC